MVARQRVAPIVIAVRPAVARRRQGRRSALAAVILASSIALAGLAPAASAQSTPRPDAKAFERYRTCMKNHGVKLPKNSGVPGGGPPGGSLPDGGPPNDSNGAPPSGPPTDGNGGAPTSSLPKGVSQKKVDKAQKACRSKLPKGARGGPGGGSEDFQAYLSCLRDHGVDVPEPGKNGSNGPPSFDPNDPTFAAANETCGALAPNGVTTTTQAAT
jgi:hypothetical protein